jgi:acyl carrier protein
MIEHQTSDLEAIVMKVLSYSSAISLDRISLESTIEELYLDSIGYVSTVAVLQAELNVELDSSLVERFMAAATVAEMVRILRPVCDQAVQLRTGKLS